MIKKCPDCKGAGIRTVKFSETVQARLYPNLVFQAGEVEDDLVMIVCRKCRRGGISTGYIQELPLRMRPL